MLGLLSRLEDFESWEQGFQKAVRSHQEGSTLELGKLAKCSFIRFILSLSTFRVKD